MVKGTALHLSAFAAFASAVGAQIAQPPATPAIAAAPQAMWLDQGWTDQQREWFHHASQGTDTLPIPYAWFIALERPQLQIGSPGLFSDSDYLDRFGFIPARMTPENPAALPVGFARTTTTDPINGRTFDQLGFTCAACHTGRMTYRGTALFIDGGPAMTDVAGFRDALGKALLLTKADPVRFLRFAARVLGPNRTAWEVVQLRAQLEKTVL